MTPAGTARRIGAGARNPDNWVALVKFGLVGGSGFVINLIVFTVSFKVFGLHHIIAAILAFAVAVMSNFYWNRRWTFQVGEGRARQQAVRFFSVSLFGLLVNLIVLEALVSAGLGEIPSQVIGVAAALPVNFVLNKLWTFE